MAITRRLIELMGGTIAVESEVGKGTKIDIRLALPRADAPDRSEAPVSHEDLHDFRVLVVDDNEVNRIVSRRMLQQLGAQCDLANDGRQALDRLAIGCFDVVLMDVHMPVMDGLSAIRHLRASDWAARDVPVVALTASAMADDRQACMEAGADAFLTKPAGRDDLRRVVREVVVGRA